MTPIRAAERCIHFGIGLDLQSLRSRANMSLMDVTRALGWAAPMELQRYETASPNHRMSIGRYLRVLGHYFDHLPNTARADHPAAPLLHDAAVNLLVDGVSGTDMRMSEYLGWVHAHVRAKWLPPHHPGEQLWLYVHRLGAVEVAL